MRNGHRGKSHATPVHVHAHACAHAAIGNITCSRGGASGTEFTVQPAGRVKGGSIRMRPPWEIVVALKLPRTGIHTYTYMRSMHACMLALRVPLRRATSTRSSLARHAIELSLNVRGHTGCGGTAHSPSFEGGQHARSLRFSVRLRPRALSVETCRRGAGRVGRAWVCVALAGPDFASFERPLHRCYRD